MTTPKLLSANETAACLGVSVFTVRRLARAGALAPVRLANRGHLRFRPEDVDALIERGKAARSS